MRSQAFSAILVTGVLLTPAAAAEVFHESLDTGRPTWRFDQDPRTLRLLSHARQSQQRREGAGAELIQVTASPGGAETDFVHSLPPAVAIQDLKLSVWVRSNQGGMQLRMRLVFPDETDPETGGPLTALLVGDRYRMPNRWQELTCTASGQAVRDAIRRTRYRLSDRPISEKGLYVDQAVLSAAFDSTPSKVDVLFDDLTFGPIVEPARANELQTASAEIEQPAPPLEFRLNHLTVEGEPFFPVMVPFHGETGETIEGLVDAGINVAWIKDYRDDELLQRLYDAGIWSSARPPRAETPEGVVLDAREAGIRTFGPETRPILFWNLGPRIPAYTLDQLIGWVGQIQSADTEFRRPTLADVTGGEYAFSNHVEMLGVSRHITNTAIAYDHYRDWLKSRRSEAFLNTFFWTWVQTEPTSQVVRNRAAVGNLPVVIEPEQIRLQVYAALQAGCRGIGYWKTIPFEADSIGNEERRLALARLNMELELLEPLLATGTRTGSPNPFSIDRPKPGSDGRRVRSSYHQLTMTGLEPAETPFAPSDRPPGHADAVMIKTDLGSLLIAVWYGESAQLCPGQMAANDVKITVPGVDQTAAAWLLTPTGVEHLPDERVTGGRQITLKKFDQTAAVLFTADPGALNRFRRTVSQIAPAAAEVTLQLARAKRQRVADVHQQLMMMAPVPDAPAILRQADSLIRDAQTSLARRDYHGARIAADDALQALRSLQRVHWEDAVRRIESPLASPHTVCFSTLPDHYRLIAKVGRSIMRSSAETNLLPEGDFEDWEAIAETWLQTATESPQMMTGGAFVASSPKQGNYALQLVAQRREGVPPGPGETEGSVTFTTAPFPAKAGQVLHISGWVRVVQPIPDHLDGAMIHDSLLGSSAGLRWTKTNGWEPFEMLREVPADTEVVLTLTLHGLGEVHFDDIRVVPHSPRMPIASQPGASTQQ